MVSNSPGAELGPGTLAECAEDVGAEPPQPSPTPSQSTFRFGMSLPGSCPPPPEVWTATHIVWLQSQAPGKPLEEVTELMNRRLSADFPKRVPCGSPNLGEAEQGPGGDEAGEVKGVVHGVGGSVLGAPTREKVPPIAPAAG